MEKTFRQLGGQYEANAQAYRVAKLKTWPLLFQRRDGPLAHLFLTMGSLITFGHVLKSKGQSPVNFRQKNSLACSPGNRTYTQN